jgi:hypothetical protein
MNTHMQNIQAKESQRLFRKIGKKYVPVNDPYVYDGLREGWWLVKVDKGCTSIRAQVHPDKAHITAAARNMEEKLIDIIRKACEARPSKRPCTPEMIKHWAKWTKLCGNEMSSLEYPSFHDNAHEIINALLAKDEK